ncbi:hypothetical protein JCM33374_g402 [Metschnikowia sp. JCM 33374]|nr:hypothetical protein JCM33374_g402 [Metschnikowia sp. JCM 33374]
MNRLNLKDLQRLALHCGYRTDTHKPSRLKAIQESGQFFDGILAVRTPKQPFNVLSVDVGIKNFSYSKVSYTGTKADIKEWSVLNLHDAYGTPDYAHEDTLVDSKAYMAKLSLSVVDNILISKSWVPNIITIENQRTRSTSNKATLPNVLLNYTLEHMLYAAFLARQTTISDIKKTIVVPMSSNKMVNFWMSRYTSMIHPFTPSKSKTCRRTMLFSWLKQPDISPFDMPDFINKFPSNFPKMGPNLSNNALKSVLGITRQQTKVDDLVDSLLYNITISRQISHHLEMKKFIEGDDKDAILELLEQWDKEHISFMDALLQSRPDVCLAKEYEKFG